MPMGHSYVYIYCHIYCKLPAIKHVFNCITYIKYVNLANLAYIFLFFIKFIDKQINLLTEIMYKSFRFYPSNCLVLLCFQIALYRSWKIFEC